MRLFLDISFGKEYLHSDFVSSKFFKMNSSNSSYVSNHIRTMFRFNESIDSYTHRMKLSLHSISESHDGCSGLRGKCYYDKRISRTARNHLVRIDSKYFIEANQATHLCRNFSSQNQRENHFYKNGLPG